MRPEVDAIVLKALAKNRDYRYQSADEMRDDIERFLDGLPVAAAQQAAAYGMGGYGYDQNGYPQQHDPYGQTNLLPQQGGAPTTMLPPVGGQGQGYGQGGYQADGYDKYGGGNDGYDDGQGRAGRRREEQPKKSNTSWIILAIAAVLVLVGSFFVATAMFKGGNSGSGSSQVTAPSLVGKSLADAQSAAQTVASGLQVTQGAPVACADQPSGMVCKQLPAAGTKVAGNSTITVQLSTGPAQSAVPDVTGKPKDTANQTLTAAGFVLGTPQYANDPTIPQDSVISENPPAGSQAAPGATITLTISQGQGKVSVPSVVGQTTDAATQTLTAAGFQVDSSKTTPSTDPTKTVGTVASQSPAANGKAAPGATITLTIYATPAKVQVPDVTGKSVKDATAALLNAGLTFTYSGPSDSNAMVVTTNPGPNQLVNPNSNIVITTVPAGTNTKGPIGGTFGSPPFGGIGGTTPGQNGN